MLVLDCATKWRSAVLYYAAYTGPATRLYIPFPS